MSCQVNTEQRQLIMIRDDLSAIPDWLPPGGYSLRFYRPGDQVPWARIEASAGEFASEEAAMQHFEREFGPHRDLLPARCLFCLDSGGLEVGTATAWFDPRFQGREYGRLHWVAVHGQHQGRGVGKALVAAALRALAGRHPRAYLTTQPESLRAIRIYLESGFRPLVLTGEQRKNWAELTGPRHALAGYER